MLIHTAAVLVASLGMVWSRGPGETIKSMPTISNSLVNLGKMDINFHFNTKLPELPRQALRSAFNDRSSNSLLHSKPELIGEELCPCSSLRNIKETSHPSEIINRILNSNDLFSFKKEPVSSAMCCDSHEHIQEDTVFFELGPKQSQVELIHPTQPSQLHQSQSNGNSLLPFIFENLISKQALSPLQMKPKAIEILFFPKKKDITSPDFEKEQPKRKDIFKKSEVTIVGDKELRNDFKTYKFRPSYPIKSLMKKEIQEPEVKMTTEKQETPRPEVTVSQSNAI